MGGEVDAAGEDRFLPLAGACNARDLGGLRAAGGRRTRPGRLLRSDFPTELDDADARALLGELGLRTVLDLRTEAEAERSPGPWAERGVDVVRAPLPLDPELEVRTIEDLVRLYGRFVEPPAAAMTRALRTLIDPDRQPLLIHCAAGKDRTGVLVALALELLGVERDEIVADYVLTAARMPMVRARIEAELERRAILPVRVAAEVGYSADAAAIEGFLDDLWRHHGGALAWAAQRGIEGERLRRFRERMLVEETAA